MRGFSPFSMLLFFLAFVGISMFIIFIFIVPNVRVYKKVKVEASRHEYKVKRLEGLLKKDRDRFYKLTKKRLVLLNNLDRDFDAEDFMKFAKSYFQSVSLSKIRQASQGGKIFTTYELNLTSSLKSPENFYKFLDKLKEYKNVIKANFPVKMIAKNDTITASFNIKIYNTTYR